MSLRNWQKLTALSGIMANTTPLARHPAFAVAQHWKAFDVRRWKFWYLRGIPCWLSKSQAVKLILKSIESRAQPNLLLAALLRLDLASSPNTAALILGKSSKRRAMHKVHKVRVRLWKILGAQGVQEIAPFQLKANNKNHQKTRTCTFQRKQVEIVSSAKVDTLWTPWTRLARPGKAPESLRQLQLLQPLQLQLLQQQVHVLSSKTKP